MKIYNDFAKYITNFLKIIAIMILIVIAISAIRAYVTVKHEKFVIRKAERVDGQYLVFTDKEVLRNVDDIWFLKFDSSDIYGNLSANYVNTDKPVTLKVNGFRMPIFSIYRNIIKIDNTSKKHTY